MLSTAAFAVVLLIALLHVYILVLEIFLWDKPTGLSVFGLEPDFARATRTLAANQGLYNGFLAAGLFWGVLRGHSQGTAVIVFFLLCVLTAGVFGAITVSRRILFVQALPAALALILLALARSS